MNEPDIPNKKLSEQIGDLRKDVNRRFETVEKKVDSIRKDVDSINTALYGTGNPHGGLFGKIEGLDAKIDGMDKNFDRMFNFAKWTVGGLFVIFAVPIFFEIVLPILRKWIGG